MIRQAATWKHHYSVHTYDTQVLNLLCVDTEEQAAGTWRCSTPLRSLLCSPWTEAHAHRISPTFSTSFLWDDDTFDKLIYDIM